MSIKQRFDDAIAESEEMTAVMHRSHCRSFRQGAQECREMLARFVEQGGDPVTAASIRANWNPSWGADQRPPGYPRRPGQCAVKTEWRWESEGVWMKRFGPILARVYRSISGHWRYELCAYSAWFANEVAESPDAAKSAAEDAVRRFAAEIMEAI